MRYKKILFGLTAIVIVLAVIWYFTRKPAFPQKELMRPATITIQKGTEELTYTDTEPEFETPFQAIECNWWKTAPHENEYAADSELFGEEAPQQIMKLFLCEELSPDDMLLLFHYEEPFLWKKPFDNNGKRYVQESLLIRTIAFLLPTDFQADNVRGQMMISETDDIYNQGNVYAYYYNKAITHSSLYKE